MSITSRALEIATAEVGIREIGRNRGPRVDEYIQATGLDPTKGSYPWCAAFIYWAFRRAAKELGIENPLPRTAGVHKLWKKTPFWFRSELPVPGAVFCIDHGAGTGHAGFVADVMWPEQRVITIEGNTSVAGSREGDGVFKRSRSIAEINLGFLDFARSAPPQVA